MALVSCPECNNQVSDAAVSCPSCGHPMQPEQTVVASQPKQVEERSELFKAGGSNFVLNEIAAVSSVKTRNWVWLVIGLPVIVAVVFAWMRLDWPFAAGVTVVGLVVLGFLAVDEGVIASTGNVTPIKEDMEAVSQRYHTALDESALVTYQGRNTFLDMQFSVNPARISEFSKVASTKHFWLYGMGMVVCAAGYQLTIPMLYVIGAAVLLLGFLARKASLEVIGVGGAQMTLHTKASDIERVLAQLTQSIESAKKT